jgi:hypothetical protein
VNWRDWEGGLALICPSGVSGRGALRTGVVRWVWVGWLGVVDWRWGGDQGSGNSGYARGESRSVSETCYKYTY